METNPAVELISIKAISENDVDLEPPVRAETNDNITDTVLLKPGSKICPQLEKEDAIRLAEHLYGITTSKISELLSYDDRNFRIHADTYVS